MGMLDEAHAERRAVTDRELRVLVIVLAIATVATAAAFVALALGVL